MPSVATFSLEIGGYCLIGSASGGGGFKGLSFVSTELNCAFRILALSRGVSFKIPFSLRGAMPTESVRLCLMIDHHFFLPFLLWSSWFCVITDSTYVQ